MREPVLLKAAVVAAAAFRIVPTLRTQELQQWIRTSHTLGTVCRWCAGVPGANANGCPGSLGVRGELLGIRGLFTCVRS